MSYTVLARKYRPQKFADVIGQDHVVRTLKHALEQQRVAHGYIFSGHRGIGKTTIARILAMALNCRSSEHPVPEPCGECDSCREIREGSVGAMDVIEIDAATNRGIEDVRGLIATATAEPARDRFRIFILDEAHQITEAAFNALLKTLEEPPPWVVFMMATTQPEDIPQTIRSRCQHFSFHAVRFDEIVAQLRRISQAEGLEVSDEALALLAEAGDGSMRDALSIMDQAVASSDGAVTAEAVRGLMGNVSTDLLQRVMRAVEANSSEEVLRIVDRLMVEGQSATQFARQLVRFLRNALVAKVAGAESPILQVSSDERARVGEVASLFAEEELTRFLQIMLRTHNDVRYKAEQRFHLELGLLKLVHAQRMLPLEQLLSGVSITEEPRGSSPATHSPSAGTQPRSGAPKAGDPPARRPSSPPPPFGSRPAGVPPMRSGVPSAAPPSRSSKVSPLEADKTRKSRDEGTPHAETGSAPGFGSRPGNSAAPSPFAAAPFDNGSALAMAPVVQMPAATPKAPASSAKAGEQPAAPGPQIDAVREAVLEAMQSGGSQMLVQAMEEGAWSSEANTVTVRLAMSEAMIGVCYTREQEKLARQAAGRVAGRPMKVALASAGESAETGAESKAKPASGAARGSSRNVRSRAADEPVVRRMMEKFGAEIRIVIDRSER